jgi:hypothetical protein
MEVLTVIHGGEEVPGVTFYGLRHSPAGVKAAFPREVWPAGASVSEMFLHNGHWETIVWDLALASWLRGDEWTRAVRETLDSLVAAECTVAWLGLEFCDPPRLFDPGCMSGTVLAALTADGEFSCAIEPSLPLEALDDKYLGRLRTSASKIVGDS